MLRRTLRGETQRPWNHLSVEAVEPLLDELMKPGLTISPSWMNSSPNSHCFRAAFCWAKD